MFLTLSSVSLITLLVFIYYWIWYPLSEKTRILKRLPTGLSTLPILGILHHYVFSSDPKTALMRAVNKVSSQNLRVFCLWNGPFPLVFVNHPEDIQTVLGSSKTLHKSKEYNLLKYCAGEGLGTAEVPTWKVNRRPMRTLFHSQNLEHLVPVFNNSSQQLVQKLKDKWINEPVDISCDFREFTVKNALCLTFGPKFEGDMDSKTIADVGETIRLFGEITSARFVKFWLRWDCLFNYLYSKQIHQILNLIYRFPASTIKVIEEYKETLHRTNYTNNLDDGVKPAHRYRQVEVQYPVTLPEIYKALKEEHFHIKKNNLIDEIYSTFAGGTDTITIVLSNCILALAAYPHIQTKLYNEICEKVGNKAGAVTSGDVSKLKYMDCVLKETLRRFNTVPYIGRVNECEIKIGGCRIPAGTTLVINFIGMHNNPQLYPDPEIFDPDRFTDENINKRHKYSFLPLSGGARDCIGKKYAWLIMKIVLVHLIREFQFTTTVDINKLEFCYNLTLKTKSPNPVSIKKRNVCF